jgi:hypothetical protein
LESLAVHMALFELKSAKSTVSFSQQLAGTKFGFRGTL